MLEMVVHEKKARDLTRIVAGVRDQKFLISK